MDTRPRPLTDGSYSVPKGELAVVVTHLSCDTPVAMKPRPDGLALKRENRVEPEVYRELFKMIGRDWLWTSRLLLEDDALVQILLDPDITLYTLEDGAEQLGMVELDQRDPLNPEISFFGLTPTAIGKGTGSWLMSYVQTMLFENPIEAVHLNTCTLDSPTALRFYMRNGFKPTRREVRIFPDPRALGVLDEEAAPFVPLL